MNPEFGPFGPPMVFSLVVVSPDVAGADRAIASMPFTLP